MAGGPYSATATATSGSWVMQLVAFKPDASSADTTPPTVSVTAPSAGATVSGDVTVTASAATTWPSPVSAFSSMARPWVPRTLGTVLGDLAHHGGHQRLAQPDRPRPRFGRQPGDLHRGRGDGVQPGTAGHHAAHRLDDRARAGATVRATSRSPRAQRDDVGVAGVSFFVDGEAVGAEDTSAPYSVTWATTAATNGSHADRRRARDAAGNVTTSTAVAVTVSNRRRRREASSPSYAFDDGSGTTAADASGTGSPARSRTVPTWGAGKYGGAPSVLDGNDDYVDLGNPTAPQAHRQHDDQRLDQLGGVPSRRRRDRLEARHDRVPARHDDRHRPTHDRLQADEQPRARHVPLRGDDAPAGTWYHVAGVYDATARTMTVYLNGQVDNGTLQGTVTSIAAGLADRACSIGQRPDSGCPIQRPHRRRAHLQPALTAAEIQTDMATACSAGGPGGHHAADRVASRRPQPAPP